MRIVVSILTGGETEFIRSWDTPSMDTPEEMRQFLTRLQTQVNTFVKTEETA